MQGKYLNSLNIKINIFLQDFYIESITSEVGFLAWQCDNYQDFMAGFCYGRETNYMGEPASSAKPGIYFLQTNAQKPFAMPPTEK